MIRIFDYTITETENQKTISDILKEKGYSHAILVHLKRTPQSILRNGQWKYLNTRVKAGDSLRITLKEVVGSADIIPNDLPLDIYYEDEDILVVNKPAGMPVHPSLRHPKNTLANAVCGYFSAKGIAYTFRCVNRLDCDTTGLVILAKHMLSAAILNQDIRNRLIHREYLAIADGLVPEEGTINAPITRIAASDIKRTVDFAHGERAVTHYRRLCYADGLSLLSLHLETGRTHQIRVHMSYLGHPLIGDTLYHPIGAANRKHNIMRQALHSHHLQFTHPITGAAMDFTSPLPADMTALISQDTAAHTQSAP